MLTETHLCAITIRNTKEIIKYYEIEFEVADYSSSYVREFQARQKAVDKFEQELKYAPSLKRQIDSREWYADSVKL